MGTLPMPKGPGLFLTYNGIPLRIQFENLSRITRQTVYYTTPGTSSHVKRQGAD
jgi:hypothetical protein